MSLTVHRSAPDDTTLPSLVLVAVKTPALLASSLSTDYIIKELSCSSGPVWILTAKSGYQESFRESQRRLYSSETKLREAEEKLGNMECIAREQDICMSTVELYRHLEEFLNKKWFSTLPRSVQKQLFDGPSTSFTRAFSYWWILWNHMDPGTYPLPHSLCRYGKPSNKDSFFMDAHFLDNYDQETCYGVAVRKSWDIVSEVDRDLMLFAWAARQGYQKERNDFAHPKTTMKEAFNMIKHDLEDSPQLQYHALTVMHEFKGCFIGGVHE